MNNKSIFNLYFYIFYNSIDDVHYQKIIIYIYIYVFIIHIIHI